MPYSIEKKVKVITANTVLDASSETIICHNGTNNITLLLPNPATCEGTQKRISRYSGSKGSITLNAVSIQSMSGSLGSSTTVSAFGNSRNWSVVLMAVKVGTVYSWLRIG